jgi:hypothetical protein
MSDLINSLVDPAIIAAALAFIGKIGRDAWRQKAEQRSVSTAILAEIKRLLRVVKEHSSWWEERRRAGDTNHPLIPFSYPIYKKLLKNIGLLRPSLAGKVAPFFGYLEFLNALQASRDRYVSVSKVPDFDQIYASSLKTVLDRFGCEFLNDFRRAGL